MLSIRNLKNEQFETVQITNDFEEFYLEEINIIYKNEIRLALSIEEYLLIDMKANAIVERNSYYNIDIETLMDLNNEVVRAMHDVTLKVYKMKTDGKKSTIKLLLENQNHDYTKKLLRQLQRIHSLFNAADAEIFVYGVNVN